jgi:metal-responsive CopG/Arc/MetJ family transcriptional regulator
MKSHISTTIDSRLLERLDRYSREERRSRSQTIEMAIERFLGKEKGNTEIPTTNAAFQGAFDRAETYGER